MSGTAVWGVGGLDFRSFLGEVDGETDQCEGVCSSESMPAHENRLRCEVVFPSLRSLCIFSRCLGAG
jgi:hypothetical protein